MKLSPKIQKLVDQAEAAARSEKARRGRAESRGWRRMSEEALGIGAAKRKRAGNPGRRGHREPVDRDAARDLELFIDTTDGLSPWGTHGIGKGVAEQIVRKLRRGKYDPTKAPKAWGYVVEAAAKRYVVEIAGEPVSKWAAYFAPATRAAVAQSLARDFEARYNAGDWKR